MLRARVYGMRAGNIKCQNKQNHIEFIHTCSQDRLGLSLELIKHLKLKHSKKNEINLKRMHISKSFHDFNQFKFSIGIYVCQTEMYSTLSAGRFY